MKQPQDPKYQFGTEDKIYHKEGKYYLPEDEPKVLFRGKDIGTIVAMEAYLEFMNYVAENTLDEKAKQVAESHANSIKERINTISNFINDNPERIGLGCHTCKPGVLPRDIKQLYKNFKTLSNV